jgi:alkanesulfonate monooxygenase SsuD/methylene tetrahydromethanopterin reductase-like flavin-dependent oxidoreductase (luciferase family)
MAKMEIGLYDIFTRHAMKAAPLEADIYDDHIRTAVDAERMGFKYYFTIEHQSTTMSYLSAPSVYLSALARATSDLRFGVMCYQLPFHNPLRLAQEAAALDHLSRGRLEFGAGTGVSPFEFTRWNLPFAMRRKISEEALQVVIQAWTQDSVTFEGEFFNYAEALTTPKPFQRPHPPIWFAAHSGPSFEFAARMNLNVAQNLDTDATLAKKFANYRGMWEQHHHPGPKPRCFLTRNVYVAETDELAHEQAKQHVLGIGFMDPPITPAGQAVIDRRPPAHAEAARLQEGDTPERAELRRTFKERANNYPFWIENGLAVVGSPDTVIRKLKEQEQRLGLDVFCAQFGFGSMSPEMVKKSIRLFGEEVIPAFR